MPIIQTYYKSDNITIDRIVVSVPARVALLGNPSDIAGGKVFAMCIDNFHARIALTESPSNNLIFDIPDGDTNKIYLHHGFSASHSNISITEYESLGDLFHKVRQYGYYGMDRLVKATCVHFHQFLIDGCYDRGYPSFKILLQTDIPRQVGLGGSSAVVIATWYALLTWYDLLDRIDRSQIPYHALNVERMELGIAAGLQDRVVQNAGHTLLMDFQTNEHTQITDPLPPLFLAYTKTRGEESGRVHNFMRDRIANGDSQAIEMMGRIADLASNGVLALSSKDYMSFARCLGDNFDYRLQLYGQVAIGQNNMNMIDIANVNDSDAKLTGSGGAIVGIYSDDEHFDIIKNAFETEGYQCVKIQEVNENGKEDCQSCD